MGIYDPSLILSDADREALRLLGELALAAEQDGGANLHHDSAPLSASQAERLLNLLEQFIESKRFIEGSYFAEGVANGHGWEDRRLKEIYLSWRKRLGLTRVASTYTWNEFVVRAGFFTGTEAWMYPRPARSPTRPMPLHHFMAMEDRLSKAADLHPRVAKLIEDFIGSRLPQIEAIRTHEVEVATGSLRAFATSFVEELQRTLNGNERECMTRRKLIAMSTLLMDTGALFITRDWTATATISMIGSTLPDIVA